MKILVADDHALFRDALYHYIMRSEPEAEVRLACDMNEVMHILDGENDISLVMLDFRMPGMNGTKGFERLKEQYPDIPVALMSGTCAREDVQASLKAGAVGYFPKTLPGKAFVQAIRKVLAGEVYLPLDYNTNEIMSSCFSGDLPGKKPAGMADQAQEGFAAGDDLIASLTPREREVLGYLVRGEPNKEIARCMGLQVVTVKLHVRGICRKLGADNRTQAALFASRAGVSSTPDVFSGRAGGE